MSAKSKMRALSLISSYPIFSTFLMTFIWQILQKYVTPFLGGYYFKWVFLYTESNPDWLSEEYLPSTRILYSVYIGAYFLLALLTLLVLFRRRGKALCSWCICGLWLADCGWIVADMVMSEVRWQGVFLLGEHLVCIAGAVLFSVLYLQLKKSEPALFQKRYRKKKVYRKRFQ